MMTIIVSLKRNWGKDLFYPVSEDAHFLAKFSGRPTLLKQQLQLCIDKGWNVVVHQEKFNLEEYLKKDE